MVLEGVSILLEAKDTSWSCSKRLLADPKFIDHLVNFDKDNIKPKSMKKLNKLLASPELAPDHVRACSSACYGIVLWLNGMSRYYDVLQQVKPQKSPVKRNQQPQEEEGKVEEEVVLEPAVDVEQSPEQIRERLALNLSQARNALDTLDKASIVEIKSFNKPPEAVQHVLSGVATLLDHKDTKWPTLKKMIGDKHFIE